MPELLVQDGCLELVLFCCQTLICSYVLATSWLYSQRTSAASGPSFLIELSRGGAKRRAGKAISPGLQLPRTIFVVG
jgi:hypothetical protein